MISQVAAVVYGAGTPAFLLFQAFTAAAARSSRPTRASTPSRGCSRSSPRTASCPASSRSAATASRSRGGSSSWPRWPPSLLIIFRGETHLLIPLYAVGVFIDFTISQSGMIRHWLREQTPGWRRRLSINAFGAVLTAVVAIVVTAGEGAAVADRPPADPAPRRDDVVHPPPVRRPGAGAPRPRRPRDRGRPPRAARHRPRQRHQPGRRPGRHLRADAGDATSGPST